MVRIRLRRTGARNQPSWRIVAADKAKPRDGRFLEILGHYNARTEPASIDVNEERLFHWLQNGADPSDSVIRVLKSVGTWDRWQRYKEGESLEALLEEAAEEFEAREVDPRTKRRDLTGDKPSKKAKAKAEAPAEDEEAAAEPEAEVEEEEPTAEAEVEPEEGEPDEGEDDEEEGDEDEEESSDEESEDSDEEEVEATDDEEEDGDGEDEEEAEEDEDDQDDDDGEQAEDEEDEEDEEKDD